MANSSRLYKVATARRAAERAAATLHHELGRGTKGLRAIACAAPWLGMFGSAAHLIGALRANSGLCDLCDCASGLPKSVVPIALSLPLAIFAAGGLLCLRRQIETIDLEMHTATLDLLDQLARRPTPELR